MDAPSQHRERGWILATQGRHELAEREYRLALAEDPHDPVTHALLAILLAELDERGVEALVEARVAIRLDPEDAFAHFAEAHVHLQAERWDEAERAALTAIDIDPDEPRNYTALSFAHLGRRRWKESLAAADEALALDPGHAPALNMRATALVHLGRKDEADATLHGALARDPENADTHANQGWALLHRGDRKGALEHFRESLRLDPEGEWAREGLAEALKARNPLYAGMLRYFLWMNRLDKRTQWMVIVGGVFGYNVVRTVARNNPELAPWLTPLMVAYGAFVVLSWAAPQIFNAVLMASRDGRYVLSPEQRRSGAWMMAGLGAVLALCVAALVARGEWATSGAMLFAGLLIPLAAAFRGPRGRPTPKLAAAAGVLYAMAALYVALTFRGIEAAGPLLHLPVLLGIIAISWISNLRAR
ncbi:MAG TPA: tetratricopeptide repeat protein [Longimicrobium sp.]|jgi:tetratricopeptide (TPR) repeat protein